MKTKEEIETMANDFVSLAFNKQDLYDGFINGYTQCQEDMADKKYTEEDMLKSFMAGVNCESRNGKNFEQFINQLNK
jgi:hypothetical protein